TTTVAWGLASAVLRIRRREEAVDSAVTVQVLMTTTSGVSPAGARSNPRPPRASRACSLSAWLSRQPRVLKATLGAAAGSGIGEPLHQRALDRVAGPGGGGDADEPGAGEHRAPVVLLGEQLVPGVAGLGPVPAQGPVGLLGHLRGVDNAGELVVRGAVAAVGVVRPRQRVPAGAPQLAKAGQGGDGHAPVG